MSNAFLEADVGAQMAADVVLLGDDAAEPQPSQQELVQIVRKAMEALATTESRRGLDVVGAAFRRARDVAHREASLDRHQCRSLGLRARFSYAEPANSASFAAWLAAIKKADAAGVADDRDDASRERRATGWSLRQAVKTRLAQLATVFCELRDRAAYDAKDDDRRRERREQRFRELVDDYVRRDDDSYDDLEPTLARHSAFAALPDARRRAIFADKLRSLRDERARRPARSSRWTPYAVPDDDRWAPAVEGPEPPPKRRRSSEG